MYTLTGHTDTPTSLSLSPNGNFLLSPSLSSQTIIHDVRPFSPSPARVHRVLMGAPAGFENTLLRGAWSRDDGGRRVAVGGADRTVCIWDVESGKVLYKVCMLTLMSDLSHPVWCSFRAIRVLSLLLTSIQKNPSVRPLCFSHAQTTPNCATVLTGSKDATMLLGEIEPTHAA